MKAGVRVVHGGRPSEKKRNYSGKCLYGRIGGRLKRFQTAFCNGLLIAKRILRTADTAIFRQLRQFAFEKIRIRLRTGREIDFV